MWILEKVPWKSTYCKQLWSAWTWSRYITKSSGVYLDIQKVGWLHNAQKQNVWQAQDTLMETMPFFWGGEEFYIMSLSKSNSACLIEPSGFWNATLHPNFHKRISGLHPVICQQKTLVVTALFPSPPTSFFQLQEYWFLVSWWDPHELISMLVRILPFGQTFAWEVSSWVNYHI